MKFSVYITFCCLILAISGCDKPKPIDNPIPGPERVTLQVPANFPSNTFAIPARNPLTKEGILLGKKLFFDPRLSADNSISCATCHQPEIAFTDAFALSEKGNSQKKLLRHTPALINLAWSKGLFWDGGARDIESLNFGPITHPDEMGQNLADLVEELKQIPEYTLLFQKAFPNEEISSVNLTRALAQFERTLISADSKYDKYSRKETGGNLTEPELEGLQLFNKNCRSCHSTDLFTDNSYHNNGLNSTFATDHEEVAYGRGRITLNPADIGKFKTPTLRNIALTAPYMHDGRFANLEEVLNHYKTGIKNSATLDASLETGISLSESESKKIILFLHTLTDEVFITNPEYKVAK